MAPEVGADVGVVEVDGAGGGGDVPLEVLEQKLTSWASNIAAAEAKWFVWLGDYVEREGWAEWGCLGAAHWLSWKCGMTPNAARERVRVATALRGLPLIAAAFGEGRLSYSKVRAVTRVANEFNEPDLADMALHATGAQLESICRGYRDSRSTVEAAAEAFELRNLTSRRNHDGTTSFSIRVLDDAASLVNKKIAAQVDRVAEEQGIEVDPSEEGAPGVSAVTPEVSAVTPEVSAATPEVSAVTPGRWPDDIEAAKTLVQDLFQVTLDEHILPQPVAQRLCCDPRITPLIEDAARQPIGVGRTTRLINRRLRRALERRDASQCQFPGCPSSRHLHAHHIIHWANGGPTELDNLILVCHFHHHLVHEGGWTINPTTRGFIQPDNTAIDPTPATARYRGNANIIEPTNRPGSDSALEPPNYDAFDLPWTTTILHHNENLRRLEAAE